jgi:hypothetical protein
MVHRRIVTCFNHTYKLYSVLVILLHVIVELTFFNELLYDFFYITSEFKLINLL